MPWVFIGLVASAVSIWTGMTARDLKRLDDAYRAGDEACDRSLREYREEVRHKKRMEQQRKEMEKKHQRMLEELKPRI